MSGNRRTPEEKGEAIALSLELLDLGAPTYAIVPQLMRRFGISRSAAYRDVVEASEQRGKEGIPARTGNGLRLTAAMLEQAMITAYADNDLKVMARLAREHRECLKAQGLAVVAQHLDGDPGEEVPPPD